MGRHTEYLFYASHCGKPHAYNFSFNLSHSPVIGCHDAYPTDKQELVLTLALYQVLGRCH